MEGKMEEISIFSFTIFSLESTYLLDPVDLLDLLIPGVLLGLVHPLGLGIPQVRVVQADQERLYKNVLGFSVFQTND